jgi:hypothetical protein
MLYVNIPKCASSWTKEYLAHLGTVHNNVWEGGNFVKNNLDSYSPIIILRDPVARWVSHSPALNKVEHMLEDPAAASAFFENMQQEFHDEHTCPQSSFIQGLNLESATFFLCDNNLSKNFYNFLVANGFPDITPPGKINESTHISQYQEIYYKLITQPANFTHFRQALRADYDLITKVKFYQNLQ